MPNALDEIGAGPPPTGLNGWVARGGARDPSIDLSAEDVREYVAAHNLAEPLKTTEQLLQSIFPPGSRLSLQIETDPEADAKWLVVDVASDDGPDAALCAYHEFVRRWIVAVTPEVRNAIRVTFNLS